MSAPNVPPAKPACLDLPSVDLKPIIRLPDQAKLSPDDMASKPLQEYYQKTNAYLLMDMPDYGIGNGNRLLEASEVSQFLAKNPVNNPKVNVCTMMEEAKLFSQMAPEITEAFNKGESIDKKMSQAKNDAAQKAEEKPVPLWQILAGVAVIGWLIRKIVNKFRGSGPKDGGSSGPKNPDPSQKKTQPSPLNGKAPKVASAPAAEAAKNAQSAVALNGDDLSTQIQRLYGGAQVYVGTGANPTASTVSVGGSPIPVMIPLLSPLPLTMPVVKPVLIVRPVPVLAR